MLLKIFIPLILPVQITSNPFKSTKKYPFPPSRSEICSKAPLISEDFKNNLKKEFNVCQFGNGNESSSKESTESTPNKNKTCHKKSVTNFYKKFEPCFKQTLEEPCENFVKNMSSKEMYQVLSDDDKNPLINLNWVHFKSEDPGNKAIAFRVHYFKRMLTFGLGMKLSDTPSEILKKSCDNLMNAPFARLARYDRESDLPSKEKVVKEACFQHGTNNCAIFSHGSPKIPLILQNKHEHNELIIDRPDNYMGYALCEIRYKICNEGYYYRYEQNTCKLLEPGYHLVHSDDGNNQEVVPDRVKYFLSSVIGENQASFEDAAKSCLKRGQNLARFYTLGEWNRFKDSKASSILMLGKNIHIGAVVSHDPFNNQDWYWIDNYDPALIGQMVNNPDGSGTTYLARIFTQSSNSVKIPPELLIWAPGQPNHHPNDNCIRLQPEMDFNDAKCQNNHHFACEHRNFHVEYKKANRKSLWTDSVRNSDICREKIGPDWQIAKILNDQERWLARDQLSEPGTSVWIGLYGENSQNQDGSYQKFWYWLDGQGNFDQNYLKMSWDDLGQFWLSQSEGDVSSQLCAVYRFHEKTSDRILGHNFMDWTCNDIEHEFDVLCERRYNQ